MMTNNTIQTMKTNQVMKRNLNGLEVQQRTKDGMFNATVFLRQWNTATGKDKRLDNFLASDNTREFILALVKDIESENADKTIEISDSQLTVNQQILIPLKSRELEVIDNQSLPDPQKVDFKTPKTVMVTATGKYGGTWMHPLLFIDLCMWLDADFKYQALKFVQDAMIHYRNMAGEVYKELSAAVASITPAADMPKVMATVVKGINYIMWNNYDDGERNSHATERDMHALFAYERYIAALVSDEFITTPAGLLQFLRKQWNKRWNPIKELA